MKKYKVCVYAICKNEVQFVDRWVDSMSEADLIVVTDTGSEDGTVERLRKRGVKVYVDKIEPWRFDVARNISLSHVPEDVDICVCTDLDELFNSGWRDSLERSWELNIKKGSYLYNWSFKRDGTPDVQFNCTKIHTRNDYKWVYPVHEYIKYIGKEEETQTFIDGITLNHFPDNTKSRGSYLPLLKLAVKEFPEDDRSRYYLGREYLFKERYKDCINTLRKYLSLKSAVWADERSAAMRNIAYSYYKLSDVEKACSWYYRAIAESPKMREPYVEFAKMAYNLEEWNKVCYLVEEALKIKEKSSTYINMGYSWDHTLYDLGCISCYNMRLYKKAYIFAKKALEKSPNNKRLRNNLKIVGNKIKSLRA